MIRTTMTALFAMLFLAPGLGWAQSGILSSQVGYETGGCKRVLVRSRDPEFLSPKTRFMLCDPSGDPVIEKGLRSWGAIWGSTWWIADFTEADDPGTYGVIVTDGEGVVLRSDPIEIADRRLWKRCYDPIAHDFLKARAAQARTGSGWRDCDSDLQEFSSHVVAVDALCDVIEIRDHRLRDAEVDHLLDQVERGVGYLRRLQDRAEALGLGEGPVVHEDRQKHVVTGNVAKAAMIFARVGRVLGSRGPPPRRTRPVSSTTRPTSRTACPTWPRWPGRLPTRKPRSNNYRSL